MTDYTTTSASTAPSLEGAVTADLVFVSVRQVFARIHETSGDGLVVAKVSPAAMDALDRERDMHGPKVRFTYLAERALLFITVPTEGHEHVASFLNALISGQIVQMGLVGRWKFSGGGRYPKDPGGGTRMEGDGGGRPIPGPGGRGQWPTIVLEVGASQTLPSLHAKMRNWFARSSHQVQIVVLVKAFPEDETKRMFVEVWEQRPPRPPRPGATTTRHSAASALVPVAMQSINIVWAAPIAYAHATGDQQLDATNFNVTRGPLTLSFGALFRRPAAGPREHDIVLSDADLQTLAATTWKDM